MPASRRSPSDRGRSLPATVIGLMSILLVAGCGSGAGTTTTAPVIPPAGTLTFASSTLAFGTVGLGAKSAQQTLTVTNGGTTIVTFTGITLAGDFTAANSTCTSTLAAAASCSVAFDFVPTATGARTGSATFNSNEQAQSITLSGTGGTSMSSLSGATLTFAATTLGSSSATQFVTLTDAGTAPLSISGFTVTGDFLPVSDACGSLVAIATPCAITIAFVPSATGTRTGTVTITSNAAGSPQTVALSGTGVLPATYTGSSLSAKVEAGTQPISNAAVQLYAAGATGPGTGSSALLASALTTNSSGIATIPAGYTCPAATSLLYLVSTGGSAGSASNANAKLIAALGPCNAVSSAAQYTVNEATTVAAAYALGQFYSAGGLGASVTNLTGLTNAFATAATLADPFTGAVPGSSLPANAAAPTARINSLANLLNVCLTSATSCPALYAATTTTTAPTNTLDAAFNLAHQPTANIAALYTQSKLSTAYTPALTAQPTDWTMFVTYSGGGLNSPSGLGVDSKGNIWVANYFDVASEFSPTGAALYANGITGYGLNNSYGLAIDLADDAWIPNEQPYITTGTIGSVTEFNSTGAALSGGGYTAGGLFYPLSVAIDPDGTTWVVDYGNSHITLLNSTGASLSGPAGFNTALFAFPVVVAVDANHYGWVGNQSSNTIIKIAPDGSAFTNIVSGGLGPAGIAVDQNDNIWSANYYDSNVGYLSNSGTLLGTYTAIGAIVRPQGIAIDGAGNVWIANYRATYLNELAGAGASAPGTSLSPATGIGADSGLLEAYAMAIDAGGNIWVSNQGSNTITRFLGLATPVKTPLSGIPKLP